MASYSYASPRDYIHQFPPSSPSETLLTSVDRGTQTNIIECQQCGSRLTSKAMFLHHRAIHDIVWECVWPECSVRFSTKSYLKKHMDAHTKEKFLPCAYCSKDFFNLNSYQKHLREHIDKPLFSCDQCKAKFSQKAQLRYHKQMHAQAGAKYIHLYTPNPGDIIADRIRTKADLLNKLKVYDFTESETDSDSSTRPVLVSSIRRQLTGTKEARPVKHVRFAVSKKHNWSGSETDDDQNEMNQTVSECTQLNAADPAPSHSSEVGKVCSTSKHKLPVTDGEDRTIKRVKFVTGTIPNRSGQSEPIISNAGVKSPVRRVTRSSQKTAASSVSMRAKLRTNDTDLAGRSEVADDAGRTVTGCAQKASSNFVASEVANNDLSSAGATEACSSGRGTRKVTRRARETIPSGVINVMGRVLRGTRKSSRRASEDVSSRVSSLRAHCTLRCATKKDTGTSKISPELPDKTFDSSKRNRSSSQRSPSVGSRDSKKGVGFFKCQFCKFVGITELSYKRHFFVHDERKNSRRAHWCTECNGRFISKSGLSNHLLYCH